MFIHRGPPKIQNGNVCICHFFIPLELYAYNGRTAGENLDPLLVLDLMLGGFLFYRHVLRTVVVI
jgi:hypothetical protein